MADLKRLVGRRITAVLWMLAVVILGLAAHAQLSTRCSLKSAGGDIPPADDRGTARPKSSQVTPIEHELSGDQDACILTAAATEEPDCASDAQNLPGAVDRRWIAGHCVHDNVGVEENISPRHRRRCA